MLDGDVLRIRAQSGCDPELVKYIEKHPPRRGTESVAGRVLMTGEAVHIPDVLADPDYDFGEGPRIGNYRALLGAPLIRDGKVDGVFTLMRPEPGAFTPRQIEIVQTFADQAVIAIENARLFEEVQARTRDLTEALQQQTATANVLKVISRSAFDLQAVLTTLAELARDLCGASFVTLSLREGDAMRLRAELGCTPEIIQFMGAHPIRAGRETFTGRVMLSGEAVHLPDVLADPEYDFGEGPRIGNYRALLAAPLLREGRVEGLRGPFGVRQVLGVFALARPDPVPFTERQIEMVRAFADQAVIAIENARLFDEVQSRTKELAASLDDLRKAQDRLIQSEKLASLGQLTAGIAHEIKNPLNFINNYSALSRELVDELAEAIKGGAAGEATDGEADELIGAIGGNLDKIVQHGKRADSIVKNMLLHSREGSGERSTTNVNAMVEEALNLAYHGARAEKPGFNVTIVKSLDPKAGAAEVYPQEMTRVLLNLISNGFYATSKRKQSAGDGAYEPTISASTRDLGPKVEIAIRDNGTGIPDEVKAKMFNPFFTTKPAGDGTGLGLSLSHDIVVKQHGGAIEVLTEPGRVHRVHDCLATGRGSNMSGLILVVDDEPDVADLFRQQFRKELRDSRFVMEFALSAADALQRVHAAEAAKLILILSDINMPGMSGLDMLPRARQARPDVPVIMITAYGDDETRRKAAEAGAAGLFTKPIDFPELRGEIGRRLDAAASPS